jgi:iron complex outermembrane receptor protein
MIKDSRSCFLRSCFITGAQTGIAVLALMQPHPTWAETAPADSAPGSADTLEEVIVTARKEAESMMKVPVTEAAVGASDLVRYQINDVTQISSQIPAIRFDQTYGGGGGTMTIRGIGSSTSDSGVDQTVATVFDGLQTSKGIFTKVGFLDLNQVEVLKGPQALFFGKNSPGGVLVLQSAGPTDKLEGYARAGYATGVGEKSYEGAISGPVGGDFRVRLAGSYTDTVGWIENTLQDTANPFFGSPGAAPTLGTAPWLHNFDRELLGRLTIDYKPNSDFSAILRLSGVRNRNAGVTSTGELVSCGGPAKPDLLGVPDPYNDCALNYRTSVGPTPVAIRGSDHAYPAGDGAPLGELNADMAGLTLEYNAGPVDITSVTGIMNYRVVEDHESATSFGYGNNGVDSHWQQYSEELRFVTKLNAPVNFAAGLYADQSHDTEHGPNIIFPLPPDPRNGSYMTYIYDGLTTSKNYSAFVQARWKIIEPLELDVGARYSHDIRTGDVVHSFVNEAAAALGFLEPEGVHIKGTKDYNNVSPEATLTWTVNPDTILFGTYRTGYKPGESGNPYIVSNGLTDQTLFYKTETVKGGELGFKAYALDHTLRLTGAVFSYKYKDLQVSNFNSTDFVLTPLAGDMKTQGFEVATTYRPVSGLTLNGALGYTRARWTHFPGVACYAAGSLVRPDTAPFCDTATGSMDLTGLPKFRSPDWSGNAGFVYAFPTFSNVNVELNANLSFVTNYNSQENDSPYAQQPGYRLLDAGLKFITLDDHLQFSIIGKNLTDVRYVQGSYDQANSVNSATLFGTVNRPRTVLFQVEYKY